jgi:cytochrome c oxidase cbb3-type subunit 4
MDIGTFRGVITVVLMMLFIALVVWAFSRRRKKDFDEAARLPLEEDEAAHGARSSGTGEKDGERLT